MLNQLVDIGVPSFQTDLWIPMSNRPMAFSVSVSHSGLRRHYSYHCSFPRPKVTKTKTKKNNGRAKAPR